MYNPIICQKLHSQHKHKCGKLPAQLVITNPLEALCVDHIGPYTLKGKDGTEIDYICLTMIDPPSSWFEVVPLLVATDAVFPMDTKGLRGSKTHNNTQVPYPKFQIPVGTPQNSEFCRKLLPIRPEPRSGVLIFLFLLDQNLWI
jgi:hypothetical protein